jgi:hypothetical protein
MGNRNMIEGVLLAVILVASLAAIIIHTQSSFAAPLGDGSVRVVKAPIAVSGDNNVYVTWWSNKSGDWEVMFKASTDGGKTFGPKINLSNSKGVVSNDAEIAAAGSNVYVTWWERSQNGTSNEPVLRVSNDNGKTFGDRVMLSTSK